MWVSNKPKTILNWTWFSSLVISMYFHSFVHSFIGLLLWDIRIQLSSCIYLHFFLVVYIFTCSMLIYIAIASLFCYCCMHRRWILSFDIEFFVLLHFPAILFGEIILFNDRRFFISFDVKKYKSIELIELAVLSQFIADVK